MKDIVIRQAQKNDIEELSLLIKEYIVDFYKKRQSRTQINRKVN
ncbi:hypothetical protein IGI56_003580 [Enterococcus sp. AZ192]